MTEYRYKLEAYKGIGSRFECPRCEEKRVFTRYIDAHTGNHLDYDVGRCAREVNCGFHYTPRQFFFDNKDYIIKPYLSKTPTKIQNAIPISYIESDLLEKSLNAEKRNYFIDYLFLLFGKIIANQLVAKYKIGTSKHWDGATVFWQIDCDDKIRTGKIMKYNSNTGKRVKEPHPHITWVHSVIKAKEFELKQCFFGEHLIKGNNKPIAITESEKTAIIASVFFPDLVWLAAGSISNLSNEKFKNLKEKNVVLFPDLNAYDKWCQVATTISNAKAIRVSNYLEVNASNDEKKLGLDLADYLLKLDKKQFLDSYHP
jgi:hypothetical protein